MVTPKLSNSLNNHARLQEIARSARRQDGLGRGPGGNWTPGSGPIFIVWPDERTVQRCVQMVAGLPNQSIILLEQAIAEDAVSFAGWATTVGAFDADTGEVKDPDAEVISRLDHVLTGYENELHAPPREGPLRNRMQELQKLNYDADFIVTSAIALGYAGDLRKLRDHYNTVVV